MKTKPTLKSARQWLSLFVGILLTAVPFPLFFIPNHIAPGGITGVSTLLHSLLHVPVGMMSILLNVPLFLLGWRRMGKAFAAKSLLGMLGVSFVIDLLPVGPLTDEPILAAIFGGVIMGAGIGLVIRGGATTGGSDMAATLIHERLPVVSVGGVLLAVDCVVVIASGFVFSIQSALYALIAIYLATQVMDRTIEGFESAKAFFVFSARTRQIADRVLTEMNRGATLLHARGAYRGEEGDVLLCVVTRLQIPQFKSIVKEVDQSAFMMVTDVREALGEGFTRPSMQ